MSPKVQVSVLGRMTAWVLVVITFFMGWMPSESYPMLAPAIPLDSQMAPGESRTADLTTIQRFLESKVVQQRLEDFGFSTEEIRGRLTKLSDDQLHQLSTQIDSMLPGGDAGVDILIVLLLLAILAVLVIYLLGHRIVITKK